jgi:hypothetical protein
MMNMKFLEVDLKDKDPVEGGGNDEDPIKNL